jgi:hypothetical protein
LLPVASHRAIFKSDFNAFVCGTLGQVTEHFLKAGNALRN